MPPELDQGTVPGISHRPGLLKPQEKKTEAVRDYPRPALKKQVSAFLGLAEYYQGFVPNFSSLAAHLSTQPDWVQLTDETEQVF